VKIDITQRLTALWSVLFLVALVLFAAFAAAFVDRSAQVALDQRLLAQAALAAGTAAGLSRSPSIRMAASCKSPAPFPRPYLRIAAFASEEPVREESLRLRATFVLAGGPLTIAAILAGWFLARRALAPIDRLTRTASDVAGSGRSSTRFTVQSQDELGRLGATFNAMLESLETTYERERSFIGDVSHELRQPLTAITGEAELALQRPRDPARDRETLERIEERTTSLRLLIDDLLVLARADARALGSGTGEVSESLAEACNAVRPFFPDVTLGVRVREETLTIAIPAPLRVRLFANVVRNAMQAARSRVTASVTREGRDAVVTIDDDGPGRRSPEAVPVYSHRLDRSRRLRAELSPQPADHHLEHVGAGREGGAPDALLDVFARECDPGVAHQILEQRILARRQRDLAPGDRHRARLRVQRQRRFDEPRRALRAFSPHDRPHARQQFADMKRLDEIIVRARIEPHHPIVHGIARSQHQHRRIVLRLAQPPHYVDAREIWQVPVDHREIEPAVRRAHVGFGARTNRDRVVTTGLEGPHDHVAYVRIVLYDERAHVSFRSGWASTVEGRRSGDPPPQHLEDHFQCSARAK
jgi:signal transduction histidine kinase